MTLEALFPNGMLHYVAGGILIGLGISMLYVVAGLIGGASTVFSSTWSFVSDRPHFRQARLVGSRAWRLVYAAGMVGGAALWVYVSGVPMFVTEVSGWQLLAGGAIGGFGARMANGCTSGHGVCGLALLKPQSLYAVAIFLATGIATAQIVRSLGGT